VLATLTEIEARVIGCLIEKSIVTPDLYPLTLNALSSACNQKSSREPVMNLSPGEVQGTLRSLEGKHLVRTDENFKSRSEKYSQRFCGTRYSDLQLDTPQVAIVCLLLLRGPQTPGELRSRSARLYVFADNGEVVLALNSLIERDAGALLVKLPRMPGRKDAQYMHLFCGPVDVDDYIASSTASSSASAERSSSLTSLVDRVERLEAEVAELKNRPS
jgi:uncharacterized protein YceH (UPF0502 family)